MKDIFEKLRSGEAVGRANGAGRSYIKEDRAGGAALDGICRAKYLLLRQNMNNPAGRLAPRPGKKK